MHFSVIERCWLLSGPHDDAAHLARLPVGTQLVGDAWDERWVQISQVGTQRRVGYVQREYVQQETGYE